MDFAHDSMLGAVSVFAPLFLTFITCLTVFHKLKVRWRIKVNCWFCNENTRIWRKDLNWWLCPFCEQYNGFSKSGDYLRYIPEQYTTMSTSVRYCSMAKGTDTDSIARNKLCSNCNRRESLKLQELSKFVPRNESRYNDEVKAFKQYLDREYSLCDNCTSVVRDVLNKQRQWLTYYKMLFFKQKSVRTIVNNVRKTEMICRTVSLILDFIIAYDHNSIWLPIGGLIFHLCACCVASSVKKKRLDLLLIVLWVCVIILVFASNLAVLQDTWISGPHIPLYHMISACTWIIGFLSVKNNLRRDTLNVGTVTFKRIKHRPRDSIRVERDDQNENVGSSSEMDNRSEASTSTGNETSSEFQPHSATTLRSFSTTVAINSDYCVKFSNRSSPQLDGHCLNESLNSLSTLSLSNGASRYNARTPCIFERRIYSTTSCDLFKRSPSQAPGRRNILSPPKLKSVMQTSWVAGGYWQEGMNAPTLSRSSSQSSGFGSAGSNFAPSREPSVHEFDRCSVVSDVTSPCHSPRSSAANAAGSFRRRHSPVPYAYDATSMSYTPSSSSYQGYGAVEQCVRAGSTSNSISPSALPAFPTHTTTVVASPGWLSALLCGSLILNMIVLCTVLLR